MAQKASYNEMWVKSITFKEFLKWGLGFGMPHAEIIEDYESITGKNVEADELEEGLTDVDDAVYLFIKNEAAAKERIKRK